MVPPFGRGTGSTMLLSTAAKTCGQFLAARASRTVTSPAPTSSTPSSTKTVPKIRAKMVAAARKNRSIPLLQPPLVTEVPERDGHRHHHQSKGERVAVLPLEFGEEAEVHAVDA